MSQYVYQPVRPNSPFIKSKKNDWIIQNLFLIVQFFFFY